MKKLFFIMAVLSCTLGALYATPQTTRAVDVLGQCSDASASDCAVCSNPDATSKPAICSDNQSGTSANPLFGANGTVTVAVKILSIVIGVVAVIVVVISAFRMVVSAGDPNSVSGARQALIYALVGLAVAALAQAIEAFVLSKLK